MKPKPKELKIMYIDANSYIMKIMFWHFLQKSHWIQYLGFTAILVKLQLNGLYQSSDYIKTKRQQWIWKIVDAS